MKENELGYQARMATQWLLNVISQSHPRVKGQPMVPKSNKNPDDVVLECALSIKEKVKNVVSKYILLKIAFFNSFSLLIIVRLRKG